jgi:hypothetical protein
MCGVIKRPNAIPSWPTRFQRLAERLKDQSRTAGRSWRSPPRTRVLGPRQYRASRSALESAEWSSFWAFRTVRKRITSAAFTATRVPAGRPTLSNGHGSCLRRAAPFSDKRNAGNQIHRNDLIAANPVALSGAMYGILAREFRVGNRIEDGLNS